MIKRQGFARKWVYLCFAVSILFTLVLWSCQLWMVWKYPSAHMVSSSLYWLLLLLMILPLIAAAFLVVKRSAVSVGPLCLVSAVVLLTAVVTLIPVFRYQDSGSLAQTIEKRVSAQATVKRATLMYRNGDYSLDKQ